MWIFGTPDLWAVSRVYTFFFKAIYFFDYQMRKVCIAYTEDCGYGAQSRGNLIPHFLVKQEFE